MLRVGDKEIESIAKVLKSGKVFRYGELGSECKRFERRFAKFLGVKYVTMTASGTNALTAALIGLGIGPGDEVIVPSHTYMATAISVLAAGAIPVIVDIDESLTLDPKALDKAVRRRTRAVIPVHMWGLVCDMKAIMRVARKHKLLVIEDACQAVGGAYEGRMVGSIGHAGAFSFNYYKNITAGEGGAVVCNDEAVMLRAQCVTDCCRFYWAGREHSLQAFVYDGARASELEGAMLNAQLDRLPAMIRAMRRQKKRILEETADTGLQPIRHNSLDWECANKVVYLLPSAEAAKRFQKLAGGVIAGQTGRHVYTEWDPILAKHGAHHPALNPYLLKENQSCRLDSSKDMCPRSLDILNRAVMLSLHPDYKAADIKRLIKKIKTAAKAVLG